MPDSDLHLLIGRIEARMEALIQSTDEQRRESREGRKIIYDQLEDIKLKASHTERSVADLKSWKDTVSPQLAMMERVKERGIGAWMVVVFLSTAAGGVVIATWKWIAAKIGFPG